MNLAIYLFIELEAKPLKEKAHTPWKLEGLDA
jgi:hypothetical protein